MCACDRLFSGNDEYMRNTGHLTWAFSSGSESQPCTGRVTGGEGGGGGGRGEDLPGIPV